MLALSRRVGRALVFTVAVGLGATGPASAAEPAHVLDVFVAGDAWPSPQAFGHGIAFAGWRYQARRARMHATYNTDTLTVGVDRLCWNPRVCVGAQARGQLAFAGLLTDYFEGGERRAALGFFASYASMAAFAQLVPADRLFLDLRSTARRWSFATAPDTDDNFRLPASTWVFEQQAVLTAWSFAPDPSTRDPHRPSWRLRGVGGGLEINHHHRLTASDWGPAPPSLGTNRNQATQDILYVRQWAAVGFRLAPQVRVQVTERAGWGWNEDDLTRARLGGLNPYVVPIAGTPWANFLAGRYLAGQLTVHVEILDGVEVGPQVDVAGLRDIRRRGDEAFGLATGVGAFVDGRWGPWQAELRVGYSPDLGGWQNAPPHVSAYALLGRRFVL